MKAMLEDTKVVQGIFGPVTLLGDYVFSSEEHNEIKVLSAFLGNLGIMRAMYIGSNVSELRINADQGNSADATYKLWVLHTLYNRYNKGETK